MTVPDRRSALNRPALALLAALSVLAGGCPADDDDDAADCEGTLEMTFNSQSFTGSPGRTCATSQGPTFILIDSEDDALGAQWHLTFSAFAGAGTFDIEDGQDYNVTGQVGGEAWWGVTGSITVDSWADPAMVGSFDVQGGNADDTATMTASGTFDVVVAEYVE